MATLSDVCAIRDRAVSMLFHRDILARVDIPPQKIEDGRLVLQVTPARIGAVIIRGDGGPASAKVQAYLKHLRGKTFDIATVQRYVLLSNDVPGVRVQATLERAPEGEGVVDLVVTVVTKPVDVAVNVENFGSEALGRWGGLVRGDLNGVTAWGDRTSLILYSTLFGDEQQVAQAIEEVRLGDDGLLGRVSFSYGDSHPGAELAPLKIHGASFVTDLALSYPLIRSRARDLNLAGGFDYIDQNTTFGGAATLSNDRLRVFFARLSGRQDWRLNPWFRGAEFVGGLELRQGVDGLGASQVGSPTLSRFDARPDALVIRADGQVDVRWTPMIATHFSGAAQYTRKVLLSYEDFAVGDLTIGRGYDPSSLMGDKGVAGTAELRVGPGVLRPRWIGLNADPCNVLAFGFFDAARVENYSAGGLDRTVRSEGGGLSFGFTHNIRFDVTYAHPLDKVAPTASSRPSDRIMFNLTAAVF